METKPKRIYFHKKLNKYQVMIWYGGKNVHVGYTKTLEEAIQLRDSTYEKLGIKIEPEAKSEVEVKAEEVETEDKKLLGLEPEEVNLDFI